MKQRILSVLLMLSMLVLCLPAMATDVSAYTGDLVLMLTNDLHSNLGPSKIMDDNGKTVVIGGAARLAAALTQERSKAEGKVLTLDGGDYSQGTPYQDGYQQGWELLGMAALGVDYVTLGNHEFDVGDQAIENSYVNARSNAEKYGVNNPLPQPIISNIFIKYDENGNVIEYTDASIVPDDLSANAFASGEFAETGAVNYVVTEVNDIKVGLFGLIGASAYGYCKNSDLTRLECVPVANTYAKFLKEEKGCDIVICISHCGNSEDKAIAEGSEGYLDAIQSAHSHTLYTEPITVNGVIITSAGCYAQRLGVLSLKKGNSGWEWVKDETRVIDLTDTYVHNVDANTPEAKAYAKLDALVKLFDAELTADNGYFSKLGLQGINGNTVLLNVPQAMSYVQKVDGKAYGYTYVQSPLTAFIGDSFNYAGDSDVSFFFGGYVRSSVFEGEFTVSDAFNIQSTGESAIDRSAGSSLIVAPLSGLQLKGICIFDAMCSRVAADGAILYGGAGTLHTAGMRYGYTITDGKLGCDTDSIEIFSKEKQVWEPLNPDKAYLCSFTFESSQNLVSYMPKLVEVPFAPYDEATGTYAAVPADNTSEEYYAFWAPYAKGVGVLKGTETELKSWTAMYYYAQTMDGQMSDMYLPENVIQTRYPATK
ncbi:MAG: metallophosphoesterase [Christensenellales bacterium]|jgi:2',3'-cyclic-nucleotide 2'-phosphodiesterase (5'-nucleotidase family)